MKNITRCIGLIFEYALNGVVSLEALYRKLLSDPLFHVYVSSLNSSWPRALLGGGDICVGTMCLDGERI